MACFNQGPQSAWQGQPDPAAGDTLSPVCWDDAISHHRRHLPAADALGWRSEPGCLAGHWMLLVSV